MRNNIILKYTCVEFTSIKLPWQNQFKKTEKILNYPSFRKIFSASRRDIGDCKKKRKISKNKTTTLMFFDNLKNKQ